MDEINKNTKDYRDPSSNKMKNPRVWVYVLLGVLLFAGIGTWMALSANNANNASSNSISSGSNNDSLQQPGTNAYRGLKPDDSASSNSGSVQK
ncbi:hypothetical protein [Nitrosomonas ureae]|uniref:Uncharacterized protein n=1 Tax=Nitrosomonas ureae TaxID=44577 RepID=A0A2T5ISU2_9PROT|nr:hypothetical protein [Nitrosomonas ureae]PTQ86909.1 hypothetical protein C8R28_1008104 [Nitrosomonas ureae]